MLTWKKLSLSSWPLKATDFQSCLHTWHMWRQMQAITESFPKSSVVLHHFFFEIIKFLYRLKWILKKFFFKQKNYLLIHKPISAFFFLRYPYRGQISGSSAHNSSFPGKPVIGPHEEAVGKCNCCPSGKYDWWVRVITQALISGNGSSEGTCPIYMGKEASLVPRSSASQSRFKNKGKQSWEILVWFLHSTATQDVVSEVVTSELTRRSIP